MSKQDYYSILGIDKNADQSTIKKAYRKLAKEKHPDSGGNEDEFKEINEAYEILSDKESKSNYDKYGHPRPTNINSNYTDMFSHFGFNQRKTTIRRGSDLRINLPLTLEEIFNGGHKTIKYNRQSACMTCNAAGGSEPITCIRCNGSGIVVEEIRTPFGVMQNVMDCQLCQSAGVIYKNKCNDCNGHGVIPKDEVIDIKIPIGVQETMSRKIEGMGQGIKNGTAGSLVIHFTEIPHKKFVRVDNDLKYNLKLPYHTLVLGGEVNIDTIDGSQIKIKVPEFNNIGDTLRVSGKGMKKMNSEYRGDLLVNLDIKMPKELTNEEFEILEKLKNDNNNVVER